MNRLDRKIFIYHIDEGVDKSGNQIRIRHYYNDSEDAPFYAYFRTLSTSEQLKNHELGENTDVQFEINRRVINVGDFIEYNRPMFGLQTYIIIGIDAYDDKFRGRYKLRCKKVEPESFPKTRWN